MISDVVLMFIFSYTNASQNVIQISQLENNDILLYCICYISVTILCPQVCIRVHDSSLTAISIHNQLDTNYGLYS